MQSTTKELDGADGTGEEEQKIEIAIALVKKVSFWIVCRWSREDSFDLFFLHEIAPNTLSFWFSSID